MRAKQHLLGGDGGEALGSTGGGVKVGIMLPRKFLISLLGNALTRDSQDFFRSLFDCIGVPLHLPAVERSQVVDLGTVLVYSEAKHRLIRASEASK